MNTEKNMTPDDLRMENELKKMKLMIEHDAQFFYPENAEDLPPEVEFAFLKNIEAFENALMENKNIPVGEYVGNPALPPVSDIPDDSMEEALNALQALLNENQIQLNTICDVSSRELYRFITEELFLHEMQDIRIEGYVTNFIYEEFHPNHDHDIRKYSAEFMKLLLKKEKEYYMAFTISDADFINFLSNFRNSFESFEFDYYRIDELKIDEETAIVNYSAGFSAIMEGSRQKQYFYGTGKVIMNYDSEMWCVSKIELPPASSWR